MNERSITARTKCPRCRSQTGRSGTGPLVAGRVEHAPTGCLQRETAFFTHSTQHTCQASGLDQDSLGHAVMSRVLSLNARERSEEHTSELQSQSNLVCRLLL